MTYLTFLTSRVCVCVGGGGGLDQCPMVVVALQLQELVRVKREEEREVRGN